MKLALAVLCLSLLPQPVGQADAGDNVMRVRYLPDSLTCTRWCFQPGGVMPFTVVIRETFLLDNGYEKMN